MPPYQTLPFHPGKTKVGKIETLPYKPGKVDLPSVIDEYLGGRGSPMAGLGSAFVQAGRRHGVDPRLLVGIGVIESGAGKYTKHPHNFANWSVHEGKQYGSYEQAIDDLARGLRSGYLSKGLNTPQKIVRRYAPGSDNNDEHGWASVVSEVMQTLGGNPARVGRRPQPRARVAGATPTRALTSRPPAAPPGPPKITYRGGTNATALAQALLAGVSPDKALADATTPFEMIEHVPKMPPLVAEGKARKYGGTVQDFGPAQAPNDKVGQALAIAKAQIGKPYVFGAASPRAGFDCSGLIEYAFEKAGIPTPGRLVTGTMQKMGQSVPWKNIKPGDWIVSSHHVVMYTGNGQVIAAPHTGEVVQFQPLSRFASSGEYQVRRWHG